MALASGAGGGSSGQHLQPLDTYVEQIAYMQAICDILFKATNFVAQS
jgi:hypothetical protein